MLPNGTRKEEEPPMGTMSVPHNQLLRDPEVPNKVNFLSEWINN